MKLTDEQILAVARATISLADGGYAVDTGTAQVIAFAHAIEALAHERGRQQGLKEAVKICRKEDVSAGRVIDCLVSIRKHAAKGPK